ncbi:hypothetical protein [Saccharothrix sp. S26]|nr:hypothetical protein [Saccharothrix sp. S26]
MTSRFEQEAVAPVVDWFDRYPHKTRLATATPAPTRESVAAVAR